MLISKLPISDRMFAEIIFKAKFKKKLDLENPRTLNEKIQWLKLYNRKKEYCEMADKFKVRTYVQRKIGKEYLIPLIGLYENMNEIDVVTLPNSFVMKATHGSGWNIICHEGEKLDWPKIKKLKTWLKKNYYREGREWVYKHIKPAIICEEFLGWNLYDYKLFCFNGNPKYIQVDVDRFCNHKRNVYDINWNRQDFSILYDQSEKAISRPVNLNEMLEIAKILSKNIPFVRIDLYLEQGQVYFGEMTFYPENGFAKISPEKYNILLGEELDLDFK